MKRSLKALGLALVAAMAMSVVVASAQAAVPHFTACETTENGECHAVAGAIVKGTGLGIQKFKATATSELALECTELTAEGTSPTGTDTEQTLSAISFNGGGSEAGTCRTNPLNLNVHVKPHGCHFTFYVEREISPFNEDTYEGSAGVHCPEGAGPFEVEVTKSGGGTKCTITIEEQTGIGPVTYHNTTEESPTDIDVVSHAANVKNVTEGGLLGCGVANGTHAAGVYEGEATARAFDPVSGEQIDLTVHPSNT